MSKNKPNGFMCFVMDFKQKAGKRSLNVNDAIKEAGPIWEGMNAQQRGRFNEMAKRERKTSKPIEKMDCTGRPLSQVQQERDEAEQRERQMKLTIENTVKNSVKNGQLEKQNYHFIMINYFTKNRDGVYVPAELAVVKFSLAEGVHSKYPALINPGVDIFGHQYEAQMHADETHVLPLPPKAMGERNLGKLYNEVLDFIRDKQTGKLPPVYTSRDFMSQVKSGLEFLQFDPVASDETLDVYSIQYLFYVLKEATSKMGEQEKPNSIYVTDAYFERDFFDYEIGIACSYHDEKDRSKYCALSYATRWGYMFCDYMCGDIAILPKPGYHLPAKINIKYTTIDNSNKNKHSKNYGNEIGISMPDAKWEQRWDNTSTGSDSVSQADFPALGSKSHKISKAKSTTSYAKLLKDHTSITLADTNKDDDDDIIDDANNPWLARSRRVKPKELENSAFEINFTDDRSLFSDTTSVASFGRGKGRGIPSHVQNTQAGRGRGWFYQN